MSFQPPFLSCSTAKAKRIMIYKFSSSQYQMYLLKHVGWRNIVQRMLDCFAVPTGTAAMRKRLMKVRQLINIRCCAPDSAPDAASDASTLQNLSLAADGRFAKPVVDYIVWLLKQIRKKDSELSWEFYRKIKQHNENVLPDLKRSTCLLYTSPSPRDRG